MQNRCPNPGTEPLTEDRAHLLSSETTNRLMLRGVRLAVVERLQY